VAGRLWARRVANAKLWWDDWLIIVAMVLCYASTAHVVVGINLGLGIKFAYAHIAEFLKTGLLFFCINIVTLAIIKFSVLLMYYRIFKVRPFKLAVYIVGSIVAIWTIVAFFMTLFECTPISDFWSVDLSRTPHCVNRLCLFEATAASNSILDIIILCLPIKMILNLQLSLSKRVQLLLTFLLGALYASSPYLLSTPNLTYISVCVISIIRLVAVITQNTADPSPTTAQVNDYIWVRFISLSLNTPIYSTKHQQTTTETYVAVICAGLPTYRIFVNNTSGFFSRIYGSRSKGSIINSNEDKVSGANRWPSNQLPSREHDSYVANDIGPIVGYQASVGKEELGTNLENNKRYMQDIEMQKPAEDDRKAVNVEKSFNNQWERN